MEKSLKWILFVICLADSEIIGIFATESLVNTDCWNYDNLICIEEDYKRVLEALAGRLGLSCHEATINVKRISKC